jgi:hypothetical protein
MSSRASASSSAPPAAEYSALSNAFSFYGRLNVMSRTPSASSTRRLVMQADHCG